MNNSLLSAVVLALVYGCGGNTPGTETGSTGSGDANTTGASDSGGADSDGSDPSSADLGDADSSGEAGGSTDETAGPHEVTDCDDVPEVGVWQETTSPELQAQLEQGFGTGPIAVDPTNPANVYVGSDRLGIWKSTDCAATWTKVSTGENSDAVNSGMQWSIVVDPVDPLTIYVNAGFSSGVSGVYRSADGGVNWALMWPPEDPSLAAVVNNNFAGMVRMDPTDHEHLVIAFHDFCNAPHNNACLAETTDAGASWQIVEGHPSWSGAQGQTVWFLGDSDTWLYSSDTAGLWRTSNGGDDWAAIEGNFGGHNGGQLYRAANEVFYLAGPTGIARSLDGITWTLDDTAGSTMTAVTGNGTTMYASHGPYVQPEPFLPYLTSPEADGETWTQLASPPLYAGAFELAYNPDGHVLYSSNGVAGLWRLVTE